jgi:hypothetical protein
MVSVLTFNADRLNFGVQLDILPLMQIPHIKAIHARSAHSSVPLCLSTHSQKSERENIEM